VSENIDNNETAPEEKLDFQRILPIFVIVLVDLMGLTIIIPLLPLYAASYGASPAMIGALGATYPLLQFAAAPVLGRLSDRYGRKPVLVISQIGTFVGFILLGMANALPMLFISRAIDGISGGNIATAQAAITDSTTEKTRTQGLGLIGAAFGLGFILGPVIAFAALAISDNNYAWPAFIAAAFSLISIFLTAFWFKETLPKEQRGADSDRASFSFRSLFAALVHPAVGLLLLLMFTQQLAFGGVQQLLALFTLTTLGINASGNAIVFVFVGVIVVAVQGFFIGRWSRRLGDRRLVYGGLALLAVGLVLLAFTPRQAVPWYSEAELAEELSGGQELPGEIPVTQNLSIDIPQESSRGWLGIAWILISMIPLAVGGGILQPAINSLITKRVEPEEVGGMLGISVSFTSAANALAPLIGGVMFQVIGPRSPFLVGGIIMALLLVLALSRLDAGREEAVEPGMARGGGH